LTSPGSASCLAFSTHAIFARNVTITGTMAEAIKMLDNCIIGQIRLNVQAIQLIAFKCQKTLV
jgi:hypothetical protein